ncbi:MAG: transposase [Planctomycetota bacterium]|nr:transposase [Planctomycetota bacterium]
MSMRRRAKEAQPEMWIATSDLRSPGHPFYDRLNAVLREAKFDRFVEDRFERFYAKGKGRPGIAPGVYMRMLLVGYFEGISSERGVAWRCADSLSLRQFLGLAISESVPDHSSLSRIRTRIDVETHQEAFDFVLQILATKGLVRGQTIGVDATTLEANAAMRSIVRREDGATYDEYLVGLAKESGIETPTREDLAKLDKKREKKGSNDDWTHPHDPDARIVKMKDGRTHLAHKSEHAVDMDTGAVIGVTVQEATLGDPTTMKATIAAAVTSLQSVANDERCANRLSDRALSEWVADKGYHSNATMKMANEVGLRSYISEPKRGRRRWRGKESERDGTYANRQRLKTKRGRELTRRRGELLERCFAHCLETGGMRRVHLRGRENILKRYLVHVAAFNLSLVMRLLIGVGTPRGLQNGLRGLAAVVCAWVQLWIDVMDRQSRLVAHQLRIYPGPVAA